MTARYGVRVEPDGLFAVIHLGDRHVVTIHSSYKAARVAAWLLSQPAEPLRASEGVRS